MSGTQNNKMQQTHGSSGASLLNAVLGRQDEGQEGPPRGRVEHPRPRR
jgi:hypothetical protein